MIEDSLTGVLFGKTRRAILALFYGHPDESFYIRQVMRITGVGFGVVQRELGRLFKAGILERRTIGRQIHYSANKDCPIFEELKNLVMKTFGLADVLKAALIPLAARISAAFIYGSFAQGRQNSSSDVDVIVIGEVGFSEVVEALTPAQEKLRREINPTVYPPDEFRSKVAAKHHFLSSVLKGEKIFLVGSARELAGLG
ncbi:ArsR family transcriptional regulator [candidate division TA06 bacterium B3_TA06]|uniref:ArsR family transcriptional regulator n=1 Tax=candidate division TA06 bacterium B3_TA06 TaxID=2012487 RepID=A0A532UU48_UNCT6|nr:MAG: ArsR family transcriptional regulator [candidate division TA06 bacterium B3_TA06]